MDFSNYRHTAPPKTTHRPRYHPPNQNCPNLHLNHPPPPELTTFYPTECLSHQSFPPRSFLSTLSMSWTTQGTHSARIAAFLGVSLMSSVPKLLSVSHVPPHTFLHTSSVLSWKPTPFFISQGTCKQLMDKSTKVTLAVVNLKLSESLTLFLRCWTLLSLKSKRKYPLVGCLGYFPISISAELFHTSFRFIL